MNWPRFLFRLACYCAAIDAALELFLSYQYSQHTSDVYSLVQEWQKMSQIAGFGMAGILLLCSGLLLRRRASGRKTSYALAGISLSLISLLWFYFFGGPFPAVRS
jgi:hypothetical protein